MLMVSRTEFFKHQVRVPSLELSATLSAAILRGLGEEATADGNWVESPRFGYSVWDGCDALEPLGLFAAAVVATPAPTLLRLAGVLLGAVVMSLVNQVRIVSLYFTGIHYPAAFETLHVEVWQAFFILFSIGLWVAWSQWTLAKRVRNP